MSSILNILLIVLIIAFIIVFHEFGHFIFAKINGVKVEEFALGFGPKIVSKKIGETVFSWRAIPLGGSCMMSGENEAVDDPRSFNNKTVWQRISIVLAGPVFNFILAFIFSIIIISLAGFDPPVINSITENGAAYQAGVREGDILKSINGKTIKVSRDFINYTYFQDLTNNSKPIDVVVERDGKDYKYTITPTETTRYLMGINYYKDADDLTITLIKNGAADEAGLRDGDIIVAINGVSIKNDEDLDKYLEKSPLNGTPLEITYTRNGNEHKATLTPRYMSIYSPDFNIYTWREEANALQVLRYSVTEVRYWITSTVDSLKFMITGKAHKEDVGGIIRVTKEMNDTVEEAKQDGIKYVVLNLLYWAIMISANLGVMNLLPIPALDGGRLLFMLVELIRGKPVPQEKEAIIHFIGFVLLMILLVFIMYNDIINVFF